LLTNSVKSKSDYTYLGGPWLIPRRPLLALILSLVIAFSFIAFIQLEKNSSISINLTAPIASPTFSSQLLFEDVAREAQAPLISNSTRSEVYDFIVANPGIQFRGICTGLGIAIGTAEFHLGVLKKAGLISFVRDGKYKRFFAAKKFSLKEMKLISLLRHGTVNGILRKITNEQTVSHKQLTSHLSITSQGLSWQMNRQIGEGIVQETTNGIKVTYALNETYTSILPELLRIFP
jgi:DNA-binding transcriptional ArsR family regulator